MHRVPSDGAMFTYAKDDKFHGLIVTNVDDLILAGNEEFEKDITFKLEKIFEFSKIEEGSFTYGGCRIINNNDGSIELDQNEYIQ